MFRLLKFMKPYKKHAIIGALAKMIEAAIELSFPLLMAMVIDIGIKNNDSAYIIQYSSIMIVLAILSILITIAGQYFAAVAGHGLGDGIRNAIFTKVEYFSSMDRGKLGSSSIVTRLNSDVTQVERATALTIRLLLRAPFLCIGGIILAIRLDIPLALVLVILMPVLILFVYFFMHKSVLLFKKTQQKLDAIALNVKENITGLRVIKAFNKTESEKNNFARQNEEWKSYGSKTTIISGVISPITTLIMQFGIITIIFIGANRINNGFISHGNLLAFITYVNIIVNALIAVATLTSNYAKALASSKRINEILMKETSMNYGNINHWKTPADDTPFIEYDNAEFAFSNKKILSAFSLKIYFGQTIGIVGGTGSGKSTFANITSRMLDVTSGRIAINGVDIKDYTNELLRSKIGLVSQNDTLLRGTIEENLKMGRIIEEQDIIKSLKVAQAYQFVNETPDKLNHQILEGAKNLSGGQRQRLTIARALAMNPELLILDDSFSALDYLTDYNLRCELKNEYKDITKIFISQRISTVKDADVIVVLEHGTIVGIGKHEELLQNCQVYKEIDASQKKVRK